MTYPNRLKQLLWAGLALLGAGWLAACGSEPSATPGPATATPVFTAGSGSSPVAAPTPTANPALAATAAPTSPSATATPRPVLTATSNATTALSPTATPLAAFMLSEQGAVKDLPVPAAGRRVNLDLTMLQKLQNRLGGRFLAADLKTLTAGAYAVNDLPVDVLDGYRQAMSKKGWTESRQYDKRFGIYFTRGQEIAMVNATGIPDDTTVLFLAGFVPEIKGQVRGGESLVLLAQGPASTFELFRQP